MNIGAFLFGLVLTTIVYRIGHWAGRRKERAEWERSTLHRRVY